MTLTVNQIHLVKYVNVYDVHHDYDVLNDRDAQYFQYVLVSWQIMKSVIMMIEMSHCPMPNRIRSHVVGSSLI